MPNENQILIDAMEVQGFDAKDLAKKLGVSPGSVYNWVRNKNHPQGANRAKLSELLGIDLDEKPTNGAELAKPNGTKPEAGLISVRVCGNGLLIEVQVKHETARKMLEVIGFGLPSE